MTFNIFYVIIIKGGGNMEKELLLDKFQKICDSIEQTTKELEEIQLDIFTLNPKISVLSQKIKQLNEEKDNIWRILNNGEENE